MVKDYIINNLIGSIVNIFMILCFDKLSNNNIFVSINQLYDDAILNK